jgi:hypothetical protein
VFSADDPAIPTTGRRLAWARRLTSGQHPLVARVLVNRVWMNHFGRGIVATPGEFGKLGEAPTHPALLDWLAADFMEQGWSLKALHRTIMLSNAYQQTSRRSDQQERIDGDNRLYGRMSVRRLPAEAIRDRMLVASATLDRTQFGPAIPVTADDAGQIIVQNAVPRRSVYLQARRTQPESMLTAFDAPVMDVNCERRPSSTVASQSLMLMNGESVLKVARQLAERARTESCGEYSLHMPPQIAARLEEHSSSPWSYGYGGIDEGASRVTGFTELPHWTGSAWQTGETLPDPANGWVLVHGSGGHPDSRPGHAAVRRWTAPAAGDVAIAGTLRHASPNGDGVRGRVVSSRSGLHGDWSAKNGSVETPAMTIRVEPGDTIDFVTDCVANETSDSFEWPVTLSITGASGARTWSSVADFHGPTAKSIPLPDQVVNAWRAAYGRDITQIEFDRAMNFAADQLDVLKSLPAASKQTTPPADDGLLILANLCQQLLCSNEFLYVD